MIYSENKLSIIIPVYNVEKYIRQCLDSIVHQNIENLEIIIVNDGSTDTSGLICQSFVKDYPQAKYIETKNSGLSMARNLGIDMSTGNYLMFLDSDDWLYENSLKSILEIIDSQSPDAILCKLVTYDDQTGDISHNNTNILKYSKDIGVKLHNKLAKKAKLLLTASTLIVTRKVILDGNFKFESGIYHEDNLWVPVIFNGVNNIVITNIELYYYRINRKDSIMKVAKMKKYFDLIKVHDKLCDIKDKNNIQDIINWQSTLLVASFINYYKNRNIVDNIELGSKLVSDILRRKSSITRSSYLIHKLVLLKIMIYNLKVKKNSVW